MSTESTSFPPDDEGGRLAEALDVDPFLTATPEDVERGIARECRKLGLDYDDPETLAGAAMVPVRPVLEAKDRRIAQLEKTAPLAEALARAEERTRIVAWLRVKADDWKVDDPNGTDVANWLAEQIEMRAR